MIRKFRTVEEMNEAQKPVLETDAERLSERAAGVLAFAAALPGERFRGVHKFRTQDESNAFRLEWMRKRAARRQR